jgi:hypothetical protein
MKKILLFVLFILPLAVFADTTIVAQHDTVDVINTIFDLEKIVAVGLLIAGFLVIKNKVNFKVKIGKYEVSFAGDPAAIEMQTKTHVRNILITRQNTYDRQKKKIKDFIEGEYANELSRCEENQNEFDAIRDLTDRKNLVCVLARGVIWNSVSSFITHSLKENHLSEKGPIVPECKKEIANMLVLRNKIDLGQVPEDELEAAKDTCSEVEGRYPLLSSYCTRINAQMLGNIQSARIIKEHRPEWFIQHFTPLLIDCIELAVTNQVIIDKIQENFKDQTLKL